MKFFILFFLLCVNAFGRGVKVHMDQSYTGERPDNRNAEPEEFDASAPNTARRKYFAPDEYRDLESYQPPEQYDQTEPDESEGYIENFQQDTD